ncbi:hypothetical protein M758_UG078200 [Ceratodon purpureus]|nr:hypothetical protein M758_UG078200 [Ceratodon purpureus]
MMVILVVLRLGLQVESRNPLNQKEIATFESYVALTHQFKSFPEGSLNQTLSL